MSTPNRCEYYKFHCNRSYSVRRNFVNDFTPLSYYILLYYVAWAEHWKFLDCTWNSHSDKLLPVAFRNHFVHIYFIPNILCDGLPKQPYAVNGPQNQRMNVPANWKTYCNPLAFTWKMGFMPMVEEVLFILHHSHTRAQRMLAKG